MTTRSLSAPLFGASLTAALVLAVPAASQPYDDQALLRQLGFVAGQAVIRRMDAPDVASTVARRIADGMGYGGEETYALLAEASRESQIGGCRPEDAEKFASIWAGMKRHAGVEP